jgi:hypothetical protein
VNYAPGPWACIAGRQTWLLAQLPPGHQVLRECWTLMCEGADADHVLGAMLQAGFGVVSDFALASVGNNTVRIILRGNGCATWFDSSGATTRFTAELTPTWREHVMSSAAGALHLLQGEVAPEAVELPLDSGVVMAGYVVITIGPEGAAGPADAGPAVALAFPPPATAVRPTPDFKKPQRSLEGVVKATPAAPDPRALEEAEDALSDDYDHLFGATQRPTPPAPDHSQSDSPAGQGEKNESAEPAAAAGDAGAFSSPPSSSPPEDRYPTLLPDDTLNPAHYQDSQLIDELPWKRDVHPSPTAPAPAAPAAAPATPTAAPATPTAVHAQAAPLQLDPAEPEDEAAEHTMSRARLLKALNPAVPSDPRPTVLAARCPAGHLSPAHAGTCRVCKRPLPAQEPVSIPRPLLGVLRFSTGDVVPLDRGVVMGRAPQAPSGEVRDRPHVMQLPSRDKDISRNHVEVSLDGWHVFVEDLDSTNGTVVTLPGQAPMQLRARDAQLIEPGTVVSLTDELRFTFEVEQ